MKLVRISRVLGILIVLMALTLSTDLYAKSKEKKGNLVVSTGKEVSIEYTVKLEDGTTVDTSVGKKPLTYIHGHKQLIPGLEKALEGMKVGETKHIVVPPEEGYGLRDSKAIVEVTKDKVPKNALKVGTLLQAQNPHGGIVYARVTQIKDKTVVLDLNHPLAGKTLYFDVKILDVKEVPIK